MSAESPEEINARGKAASEATPPINEYTAAIRATAEALDQHREALVKHGKAVDDFQGKWSTLDAQAKALLKGCWDFDHRKWEEEQRHKHNRNLILWLIGGGLLWLCLLWAVIRCLEGAVSDIGKYGAVVLCVFLVVSLSVPAAVAIYLMRRSSDD